MKRWLVEYRPFGKKGAVEATYIAALNKANLMLAIGFDARFRGMKITKMKEVDESGRELR